MKNKASSILRVSYIVFYILSGVCLLVSIVCFFLPIPHMFLGEGDNKVDTGTNIFDIIGSILCILFLFTAIILTIIYYIVEHLAEKRRLANMSPEEKARIKQRQIEIERQIEAESERQRKIDLATRHYCVSFYCVSHEKIMYTTEKVSWGDYHNPEDVPQSKRLTKEEAKTLANDIDGTVVDIRYYE